MSYEFHKGDLYVEMLDQFNNSHGEYVPVTIADVSDWLIAEGGEIAYVYGDGSIQRSHFETPPKPGRYLVFPLPVESAEVPT